MPRSIRQRLGSPKEFVAGQLETAQSRTLALVARTASNAFQVVVSKPPPSWARHAVELAQLRDPLRHSICLPPIDLLVPCHAKDIPILELALAGARSSTRNPVNEVRLITPLASVEQLRSAFPDALVVADTDALGPMLVDTIDEFVPKDRRHWVTQQLVKFAGSMTSTAVASLVIDADTVLISQRTWLSSTGVQLLSYSRDFHLPYATHAALVWGRAIAPTGMNYITHHQLMQRDVLAAMFPDSQNSLARWTRLADWTSTASALADYYCYGAWMTRNHRARVRYGQLLNEGTSRSRLSTLGAREPDPIVELRRLFPAALSVSFHTYLDTAAAINEAPESV